MKQPQWLIQKGRNRNKTQFRRDKKQKIVEQSRVEQAEEFEDDKAFISDEIYPLWEKNLSEKRFIVGRGFGKFISPFAKIIEKKGWSLFWTHKSPGFATVVREFYVNMVEMKEDSLYIRGKWVPDSFHSRVIRNQQNLYP